MHTSSTDGHCLVHRLTVESSKAMDRHHLIILLTAIWMPMNAWASIRSTTGRCRKFHPHPRLQGSAGKETCFILHPMMLLLCLTFVLRLITWPHHFVHTVITVDVKNLGMMWVENQFANARLVRKDDVNCLLTAESFYLYFEVHCIIIDNKPWVCFSVLYQTTWLRHYLSTCSFDYWIKWFRFT